MTDGAHHHHGQDTVLLTGAFGGVGEWIIPMLAAKGLRVVCFDKASPANQAKAKTLARAHAFHTIWGDITDGDGLHRSIAELRPDLVVHAAAIIPPLTIKRPELAYAVNVTGTELLVRACEAAGTVRRLVLVSSYSVFGPSNPTIDPPRWTNDTPPDPQDDYARQKIAAERCVSASRLEWTIVRLGAVFPLSVGTMDPDTLRFSFVLPYDRREHAVDVRDAALAIANATDAADAAHRVFVVCGGEGWQRTGGELADAMMRASGMRGFPRTAYRQPDPDVAASWYYENWVDTAESERVLRFQRHGFDDYLADRRRQVGILRFAMPLLAPLMTRMLRKASPYHDRPPAIDSRPFAEAAHDAIVTHR